MKITLRILASLAFLVFAFPARCQNPCGNYAEISAAYHRLSSEITKTYDPAALSIMVATQKDYGDALTACDNWRIARNTDFFSEEIPAVTEAAKDVLSHRRPWWKFWGSAGKR